ncbi:MBL fold metallo-hydrolase [Pseudomonas sp. Pseusp97]|uniref:MBL fold metallo-hydrolase n=1 Tax=Pseudomonas sp. Pseusp97 TaxID=3243065 RepID=UPI0039A4A599
MSLDHINLWLIEDGEGWALFDTGMHTDASLAIWQELLAPHGRLGGRPLTRVIATHMHPDHVGMAGWLTREQRCELWMSFGEYMNCRVLMADSGREAPPEGERFYARAGWDAQALSQYRARFGNYGRYISPLPQSYRRIRHGQHIRIGRHEWRVLIGAGHSPEHACFHCPELKLLIAGDQVLPRISPNVSVFPTEPDANPLQLWLESLRRLRDEVPDDVLVLPAHNEPFQPLHARLEQLENSHARSLERLLVALAQEPRRVVDLFSVLFHRPIDAELLPLATGECIANLNYLRDQQLLRVVEDSQGVAWYRA